MKSATRIAVIIPCHDEPLVAAAVASLATEGPLEIVVVDDGSIDQATLEVLDRLRGEGVRVLRQENKGVASARMLGVEQSQSQYVFPLDADDWVEPGALAKLADLLDADPDAAVAWGDLMIERAAGAFYRPSAPCLDPWFMTWVNAVPACSLVRRTHLDEVGGWQEAIGYADWDLWLRLAEQGYKGLHLAELALHYRLDAGGMFRSSIPRFESRYQATFAPHQWLTEHRARWRSRSPAPRSLKLAYALLEHLPLSRYRRNRLARSLAHLLWFGTPRAAWHYLWDRV